jgi:hypothetical protein
MCKSSVDKTIENIQESLLRGLWEVGRLDDSNLSYIILCFGDRASLYNLVDKANLVHNLFLEYLTISTCLGRLCAHHQEKQMCLCNTWHLLFCVDECLICKVEFHPTYRNKYSKDKLCTKLALSKSLSHTFRLRR